MTGDVALFLAEAIQEAPTTRAVDPVCGMELTPDDIAARLSIDERDLAFRSSACLQRYVEKPAACGVRCMKRVVAGRMPTVTVGRVSPEVRDMTKNLAPAIAGNGVR